MLSVAFWSIPLTTLGAFLLHGALESVETFEDPSLRLPLEDFCRKVRASIYGIQHDYAHVRHIMPYGGFSYGSNVLPFDHFHDQHKPNNPSSS